MIELKQQTSIQWFIEKLTQEGCSDMTIKDFIESNKELILDAIGMERYEVERAYVDGWFDCLDKDKHMKNMDHKDVEFYAWCRSENVFKDEDLIQ